MSTYTATAFDRRVPAPVVSSVRRTRQKSDNTYSIISRDGKTRYEVLALKVMVDPDPNDPQYIVVCPCTAGQNGNPNCWHAKKVRRYLKIGNEDGSI